MVRFIFGLLASIATILVSILLERGNLGAFFVPNSATIAVLVPFFAVLAVYPLREWGAAWKDALGRGAPSAAPRSADIWEFQEKACYASGFIGFIVGLVLVFSQLNELSGVGRGLAAGLSCPMYAVLLGLVCRILKARVMRRRA